MIYAGTYLSTTLIVNNNVRLKRSMGLISSQLKTKITKTIKKGTINLGDLLMATCYY